MNYESVVARCRDVDLGETLNSTHLCLVLFRKTKGLWVPVGHCLVEKLKSLAVTRVALTRQISIG